MLKFSTCCDHFTHPLLSNLSLFRASTVDYDGQLTFTRLQVTGVMFGVQRYPNKPYNQSLTRATSHQMYIAKRTLYFNIQLVEIHIRSSTEHEHRSMNRGKECVVSGWSCRTMRDYAWVYYDITTPPLLSERDPITIQCSQTQNSKQCKLETDRLKIKIILAARTWHGLWLLTLASDIMDNKIESKRRWNRLAEYWVVKKSMMCRWLSLHKKRVIDCAFLICLLFHTEYDKSSKKSVLDLPL